MHKLCNFIDKELDELEEKVTRNGKLSGSEVEYGKNLAKFKMALLTNDAMERDGYSNTYYHDSYGRKRDSMGRYSRDPHESFMSELHDLSAKAPDEHTRRKVERMIDEMR